MRQLTGKQIWIGFLILLGASWIPVNLWLQRHNDALFDAVSDGDLPAAQSALSAGASVHMEIRHQFTLLHVAALHHDNVEIGEFLVTHGVSPDARNDENHTALQIAEQEGHPHIAAFLRTLNERRKRTPTSTSTATNQPRGRG